jgi:hypothetical protein
VLPLLNAPPNRGQPNCLINALTGKVKYWESSYR